MNAPSPVSAGSTPTATPKRRKAYIAGGLIAAVVLGGVAFELSGEPPYDGPARVDVASISPVGDVLVDGQGKTLYRFAPDEASSVTCNGGCADKWPPLTVTPGTPPSLSAGVDPELLGQVEADDGSQVVTYAGWPLYRYDSDDIGEASGHEVDENGGEWFAVTADGQRAG